MKRRATLRLAGTPALLESASSLACLRWSSAGACAEWGGWRLERSGAFAMAPCGWQAVAPELAVHTLCFVPFENLSSVRAVSLAARDSSDQALKQSGAIIHLHVSLHSTLLHKFFVCGIRKLDDLVSGHLSLGFPLKRLANSTYFRLRGNQKSCEWAGYVPIYVNWVRGISPHSALLDTSDSTLQLHLTSHIRRKQPQRKWRICRPLQS